MSNTLSNGLFEEGNKGNNLNDYTTSGYNKPLEKFLFNPDDKKENQAINLSEQHGLESSIDDLEQSLVSIWQYALGLNYLIGRKDSFFNLGGSSLNVVQLITQLYKKHQVRLTRKDIVNHPVLADQARLIRRAQQS